MTSIMSHLPLALFTTLGALGAGAFVGLAIAFVKGGLTAEQEQAADRKTPIFFVVALLGLIAAVFHLTAPLAGFNVVNGIGRSPLSNEVAVFSLFMVVAAVYSVMAFTGKLGGARKGLVLVTAVLALVLGVMMGMAYMVYTIPSWNNPGTVMQMLGFVLAGSALALVALPAGDGTKAVKLASVAGLVLAVVGLAVQVMVTGGVTAAMVTGAALVSQALPLVLVAVVLAVVAAFCLLKDKALPGVAALVVATFVARLAFYVMEIGVGL
ncbi:MAG: dimethyl sulfoxide reductase anchor subunit [Coriobacteriia bacterium]|nr:dimethyl sulfoxide reductase anchor subunit [Coriobacteriia bacterium]